ncbi:MAG: lipid-A-disaccharide synthase [Burkholderiales bacterium]|nr:lipid-A-disaccharide synthase [Burkholderiales bacterium]
MLKIAMIAGEASGDMLASSLISALKEEYQGQIEFVGIGGSMMKAGGFQSWHEMETLSVMGYIEVVKSLPKLLKLRYQILKELLAYKPDIFIGVDAPDFTFYIENKLKQSGIKTAHYISPTIWAWRYERIHNIKKSTDLMLCIFPFEEAIYHKENIAAKFVGHPMANDIELDINTHQYRTTLELPHDKTIYTVLSGSRIREVNSLAQILSDTCEKINQNVPNALFVFPFANKTTLELMQTFFETHNVTFQYRLLLNKTRDALKACDFAIAKSGTVSLEAALCKKPMLICYKINKFTEWMVRKKITIKYVGQPNIIANKEIVKEFLQEDANSESMSEYMINLYHDKTKQQQMIGEFYKLHLSLQQNASIAGAKAILDLINNK